MIIISSGKLPFFILILAAALIAGCSGNSDQEAEDSHSGVSLPETVYSAEAQEMLKQIYIKQQEFYAEHQVYSTDLEEIGMIMPAGGKYRYLVELTPDGFTATAKGIQVWEIDQDGNIYQLAQK
ncbi:MAG: hypothetical protein GF404_10230 [candidate division Zixibacteria bacterium]|nr:hypothetical protein [candidate division Zixibacteria bacterium]